MPVKKRKIEIHKLTISGLPDGTAYGGFIKKLHAGIPDLEHAVFEYASKSHALEHISLINHRLRMRFLSFTTGYRPDILDTTAFSISPNPLAENQTGVEWTHVLGALKNGKYLLLIEKHQGGIWPSALEEYLQWLADEFHTDDTAQSDGDPITFSLEAEPAQEFIDRIDRMSRVTKATVRTVRPNPGWADLDSALAQESAHSDAHKSDVTMMARRKQSLNKDRGIVGAIKTLFRRRELDYAAIEGQSNGKHEQFSTKSLGDYRHIAINIDGNGQIDQNDAWLRLTHLMDNL